jgi:hypothetical protein
VIGGLLAIGAVANFAWNLALPETAVGFRPHPDNSLSTLVRIEQPTVSERHSFDAYLHDYARNGVIRVPTSRVIYPLMVENFAQMTIEETPYDPETTWDAVDALGGDIVIIERGIVARAGVPVSYRMVFLDDTLADSVTYYTVGDAVVIIDDRLGTP